MHNLPMPYKSKHIQRLFGISRETVRVWTKEFAPFMSPTATPGKGRHRQFTDDDLRVFSLIHESKRRGAVFDEIYAALENGQRGPLPEWGTDILASGSQERKLVLLEAKVSELETLLSEAESERDASRGIIRLLQAQLDAAHRRIDDLNREIGRIEGKRGR